jgi:hypothetical protein
MNFGFTLSVVFIGGLAAVSSCGDSNPSRRPDKSRTPISSGNQSRSVPPKSAAFPKIGTCVETQVKEVMGRLGPDPGGDSGSAVFFRNGRYQIGYDVVTAIVRSRAGDNVRMCVVDLPKDCPPGDSRGIVYRTKNLRTGEQWELPDSEHDCGGP